MDNQITVIDFKTKFAGVFRFQPYPTWVKTIYDIGDIVLDDDRYYKSLVANNTARPISDRGANWAVLSQKWALPGVYGNGMRVRFKGLFYESLIDDNDATPTDGETDANWKCLTPEWVAGTYNLPDIVWYKGDFYQSMENGNQDEPGTSDKWQLLNPLMMFDNSSDWVSPAGFSVGAIVSYVGKYYESLYDNNTQAPTDVMAWKETQILGATAWAQPIAYKKDDKVLAMSTPDYAWHIYESLNDDNYAAPTDESMWNKTNDKVNNFVSDSMIEEAFLEARTILPEGGIGEPEEYKAVFLLLAAHFLITDWQASNAGLNANGSSGIVLSRRVNDFNATYALNPILVQYPQYALLATTYWGQKALMLMSRHWVGNVITVDGSLTNY